MAPSKSRALFCLLRSALIASFSLFSFAKFLELLLYSPTICTLSHTLCTHTSPSSATSSLPASRFNIIRHFSHKSYRVSFTLSPIDDIFDLLMPRLQFTKGGGVEKTSQAAAPNSGFDDTDKKELRQEIKCWWQAIAEHLDKVVCFLSSPLPAVPKSTCRRLSSPGKLPRITKACHGYLPQMMLGSPHRKNGSHLRVSLYPFLQHQIIVLSPPFRRWPP